MKRTERLNTMMRYMNNRQFFTISELMREFSISRSTAIRDVHDIEALGMPLVAEVGRDGGYSIMTNQLLPAVQFTNNELKALFIAFLGTANQQLPYLQNRKSLSEKLLAIASTGQQDELVELKRLLHFENTNPNNPDLLELNDFATPMLNTLLELALKSRYLIFDYQKSMRRVYLLNFFRHNANWYAATFDFLHKEQRTFRVDHIEAVHIDHQAPMPQQQLTAQLKASHPEPNLMINLGAKAINKFKQMHLQALSLHYLDAFQQTARFSDFIDVHDTEKLTSYAEWLLFLGDELEVVKMPDELRHVIRKKIAKW
ncbi:helix-turn-helix transcriptional regulator [Sporolactobacillus laevolacticus]|uniref:Decaprenyl diphosphate synthase n=1 Tax=Sporolactobacillus laevolacticus DSM 442 TaxID=1395513 RepID=V6IUW9_9BACL|nr:WYL domain-containing protein [Sporolactobacillus laevolacticus]EST10897.1 decaprenyl diphosphate synthase [Sporolactobacillus laevolacticus DSM 442]